MPAGQTRIVELHGFSQSEKKPFISIFSLSKCRPIAYKEKEAADVADLHLINTDNPAAMENIRSKKVASPQVILIGNSEPSDSLCRRMTKPIRWIRLFELLDDFIIRTPGVLRSDSVPIRQDWPSTIVKPVVQPAARVLVVDDNLTVRQFMAQKLNPFQCEVDFAESGEQALELSRKNSYVCVFLDVVMDGIDGYQTCKILKQNAKRRDTAIIMLTSRSSPVDRIRGKMAGCNGYLTKPVDEEKLLEIFAQFFSRQDSPSNAFRAAIAG